jgi:hypothetical protein
MMESLKSSLQAATASLDQPTLASRESTDNGSTDSLSVGQKLAQEVAALGGLLDLSFQDEIPNRTGGLAGGMNESGRTDSATQAACGTLQVALAIGGLAKNFLKLVGKLAIEGTKKYAFRELTSEIAEAVMGNRRIARYMAPHFATERHVARYSALRVFAGGHGGGYQAHHIVETRVLKRLFGWSDEATAHGPAIILTQAEHINIHNRLQLLMPNDAIENMTKDQVLNVYKRVYTEAGYEHLVPKVTEFFKGARVTR